MSLKIIRTNGITINNETIEEINASDTDKIRNECKTILESAFDRRLTTVAIRLNTAGIERAYSLWKFF